MVSGFGCPPFAFQATEGRQVSGHLQEIWFDAYRPRRRPRTRIEHLSVEDEYEYEDDDEHEL